MTQNEFTRPQLTNMVVSNLGLKSRDKISFNTQRAFFHCPFHKDKTPSLSIDFNRGIYHCFSCGRGGSIENLYFEMTGVSIYRALGIKNDPFSTFSRKTQEIYKYLDEPTKRKSVFINYDKSALIPALENESCREYIRKRGIPESVVESVDLRYCEETRINTTLFKRRLCIPVYEEKCLISIEGRKIFNEDDGPKVLYPLNTSVNLLYDIDNLDRNETLYAVEGLMDLFVLRGCPEFKNSTSIFGAGVTKRQIEQMKEFKKIVYIPDNDDAGKMTVDSLKDYNLDNMYILKLPNSINGVTIKDVGDLPKAEVSPQFLLDRKWLNYLIKLN